MENDAATLYCPNDFCQSPNQISNHFCQRCSTPLPKRYLWVVTDGLDLGTSRDILAERYLIINKNVVLDTKPGLLPQTPDIEKFQEIKPYLRLFPYRLHIPQVYGVLPIDGEKSQTEILLLEKPPLSISHDQPYDVELLSDFTTAWSDATSMRQLNWLWQIAHLWQPLASEGVAASLLEPDLLRVEGSLIRVLELRSDGDNTPQLSHLGKLWQSILPRPKNAITQFVRQVCRFLIEGNIYSAEQLIAVLDKGLAEISKNLPSTTTVATQTDTGPSRQRNEDACYPPAGSIITKPPQSSALAIVCDGIGGHEGGNVASNLAIQTIQQDLLQLANIKRENVDPAMLLADLEQTACHANDKISQANDNENRQGRQRMGTTLVMALPIAHEMYISHVGDSRAYLITRHGCYQVTLDDDVASREVRLGYAIYREALLAGSSGSLVQALGMGQSMSLHPTSQRFVLDEDCVFLLCSDGLSDYDRVEQYWESEILPILNGQTDVTNASKRLLEIANTQNGHDNVTIALTHYQLKFSEPQTNIEAVIPQVISLDYSANEISQSTAVTKEISNPNIKTKVLTEEPKLKEKNFQLPFGLIIPSVLAVAAGSAGLWAMQMRTASNPTLPQPPKAQTAKRPVQTPIEPTNVTEPELWALLTTKEDITFNKTSSNGKVTELIAPKGSVLQITKLEVFGNLIDRDYQLNLRLCPSLNSEPTPTAKPNTDKRLLLPKEEVSVQYSKLFPGIASIQPSDKSGCSKNGSSTPPVETKPSDELEEEPTVNPSNSKTPSRGSNQRRVSNRILKVGISEAGFGASEFF